LNKGTIATRRWSSTLLNSGSGEDTDGNSVRLSMEFDIVELGNGRRHCDVSRSMEFDIVELVNVKRHCDTVASMWMVSCGCRWSSTLLKLEERRLNVELKGTAGSPGCDTTYRAE